MPVYYFQPIYMQKDFYSFMSYTLPESGNQVDILFIEALRIFGLAVDMVV